jgi:hypothetical protein
MATFIFAWVCIGVGAAVCEEMGAGQRAVSGDRTTCTFVEARVGWK